MEAAPSLSELDAQLKDTNWFGGDLPNAKDQQVWGKIGDSEPDKAQFLHLWTWWTLVSFFTQQARKSWAKASGGKGRKDKQKGDKQKGDKKGKQQQKKQDSKQQKEQKEQEELDLFGSDDEQAEKALQEQKKQMAAKASKKKPPPGKSMIIYQVKPWEAEQDMDDLAKKVLSIQMDGVTWGKDYKLVPVAFGIKKLVVVCTILDDLVSTDDLQEKIEAFQDLVQSVDIQAFNKV